jgi:hypothetical protein
LATAARRALESAGSRAFFKAHAAQVKSYNAMMWHVWGSATATSKTEPAFPQAAQYAYEKALVRCSEALAVLDEGTPDGGARGVDPRLRDVMVAAAGLLPHLPDAPVRTVQTMADLGKFVAYTRSKELSLLAAELAAAGATTLAREDEAELAACVRDICARAEEQVVRESWDEFVLALHVEVRRERTFLNLPLGPWLLPFHFGLATFLPSEDGMSLQCAIKAGKGAPSRVLDSRRAPDRAALAAAPMVVEAMLTVSGSVRWMQWKGLGSRDSIMSMVEEAVKLIRTTAESSACTGVRMSDLARDEAELGVMQRGYAAVAGMAAHRLVDAPPITDMMPMPLGRMWVGARTTQVGTPAPRGGAARGVSFAGGAAEPGSGCEDDDDSGLDGARMRQQRARRSERFSPKLPRLPHAPTAVRPPRLACCRAQLCST